jgi:hypothetical protein
VELQPRVGPYGPGEEAELTVSVSDENDAPVRAAFQVAVLDEALFALGTHSATSMPARFLLESELQSPQDLENVGRYLADDRETAVALDLLLGTQRRRENTGEEPRQFPGENDDDSSASPLAARGAEAQPVAMFDNLVELQRGYQKSLDAYRASRTGVSITLTTLSFFAAAGLLVLAAMLTLLNVASGARLWTPAIVSATVCLMIGGILMDPNRWKSPLEGAVPFMSFQPPLGEPAAESEAAEDPGAPGDLTEPGVASDRSNGTDPSTQTTDADGKAQAVVRVPHGALALRVSVDAYDAYGDGGRIGSGGAEIETRRPVMPEPWLPLEVAPGDRIDLPVALVNDGRQTLAVEATLEHGESLQLDGNAEKSLTLEAGRRARLHFPLKVVGPPGECRLILRGTADGQTHRLARSVRVVAPEEPGSTPDESPGERSVSLSTRLANDKVRWGDMVSLLVEVVNQNENPQQHAVAVLGLPGGLDVPLRELETLVRSGRVDFYETGPRKVVLHWRELLPNERISLKLHLIAAVPGKFEGPTSRAYVEQAVDAPHRTKPLTVEITRD